MKKLVVFAIALALSGCASLALSVNETRAYLDACASFGALTNEATSALTNHVINVAQATKIDAVIEPIAPLCHGSLPTDLPTVTAKIVAATQTLTTELTP